MIKVIGIVLLSALLQGCMTYYTWSDKHKEAMFVRDNVFGAIQGKPEIFLKNNNKMYLFNFGSQFQADQALTQLQRALKQNPDSVVIDNGNDGGCTVTLSIARELFVNDLSQLFDKIKAKELNVPKPIQFQGSIESAPLYSGLYTNVLSIDGLKPFNPWPIAGKFAITPLTLLVDIGLPYLGLTSRPKSGKGVNYSACYNQYVNNP